MPTLPEELAGAVADAVEIFEISPVGRDDTVRPVAPSGAINWLVNSGTGTRYFYSSTTASFPLGTTLTFTSSATTTYTVSGNNLNYLSWEMGWNPGYDAPVFTDESRYYAGNATDADVRNAIVGPRAMNFGHITPEQAQRAEERARRAQEETARRVTANDRARGLLLSVLTEEQRAMYERDGHFEVIGSAGGRYRINKGSAGNVEWFDPTTGRVAAKLCANPSMAHGWLPDPDVAVAQMLSLQTDEPGFVKTANVHAGRRPPMPQLDLRGRLLRAVA